ncbi:MAG: type II secretion system protein [Verrucomicrobia bacterium]|nr:type II secretion system protein [Verrucomicrobiota bacterium]
MRTTSAVVKFKDTVKTTRDAPWQSSNHTREGETPVEPWNRFQQESNAFTLIELLVVISIIGVLASLTVGLSGVASRKSKESRVRGDLDRYVTAIENYKAALGTYPPDNPGRPSTNQLYYELSGTYYEQSGNRGYFTTPDRSERIGADSIRAVFNASGFGNSVRVGDTLKFSEEFKSTQYGEIQGELDVEVLKVPVKGPERFTYQGRPPAQLAIPERGNPQNKLNPWLYDASSPNRNNRKTFDLWAEVIIGRNIVRFSNWENEPVVIGRGK